MKNIYFSKRIGTLIERKFENQIDVFIEIIKALCYNIKDNFKEKRDKVELKPEDYKEPRCLMCDDFYNVENVQKRNVTTIPVDRVINKLDSFFDRNDVQGAKRHLEYWLSEACQGNDDRGQLAVVNELLGLYRKMGLKDEAFKMIDMANKLIDELKMEDSLTAGTVNLNIATVYEAFDMPEKSLQGYEAALAVYKKYLSPNDKRFGGLYNNMALAMTSLKMYRQARETYITAIDIMKDVDNGQPETAISYLNLANLAQQEHGMQEAEDMITAYLTQAENYLYDEKNLKDGNYAFVCEKCAPTFRYYGWFLTANELEKRSKEIYEGH